jgi:N-acetylglucosamine kinase-like BadF-type ATPase
VLLGVDGGATKTVAIVADAAGRVMGAGRDGSSDIHAVADPDEAIDRVAAAVRGAARGAGIAPSDVTQAVFSLCGADWPEDTELYRAGLTRRLGSREPPQVVNDATGALRAGTPDGVGVSLVIGTGGAIGARGPAGVTWFSGFRLEPSGAVALGREAYQSLVRGEYGPGPVPGFRDEALAALGVTSVDELLFVITRRGGLGDHGLAHLAPVLLEAGHRGDPQAREVVARHAAMLAGYARAAARRVGFTTEEVPLVLTGGVLRHRCTDLLDGIAAAAPGFRLVRPTLEPVLGALLLAGDRAGVTPDIELLRSTSPDPGFFRTL